MFPFRFQKNFFTISEGWQLSLYEVSLSFSASVSVKLSRLKLYKILFKPVKILKSFSCCDLSDVESKYSRPPLLKNKAFPTARQIAEKSEYKKQVGCM